MGTSQKGASDSRKVPVIGRMGVEIKQKATPSWDEDARKICLLYFNVMLTLSQLCLDFILASFAASMV